MTITLELIDEIAENIRVCTTPLAPATETVLEMLQETYLNSKIAHLRNVSVATVEAQMGKLHRLYSLPALGTPQTNAMLKNILLGLAYQTYKRNVRKGVAGLPIEDESPAAVVSTSSLVSSPQPAAVSKKPRIAEKWINWPTHTFTIRFYNETKMVFELDDLEIGIIGRQKYIDLFRRNLLPFQKMKQLKPENYPSMEDIGVVQMEFESD